MCNMWRVETCQWDWFHLVFWQVELRTCLSACQTRQPYTCRVQNQRGQQFIRHRHHWSTSAINIRVKLWIRFQNKLRLSGQCLYTVYDQRLYCVFHQMKTCTNSADNELLSNNNICQLYSLTESSGGLFTVFTRFFSLSLYISLTMFYDNKIRSFFIQVLQKRME